MFDFAPELRSRFSVTTPGRQRAVRSFPLWPVVLSVCVLTFWVINASRTHALPNTSERSSAHVYFLTGLFGITSHLDVLAAKVKQHGLPATMSSPGGWQDLAQSAIEEYHSGRLSSIVVIGYSTGGRSALEMAAQLNAAKVPVSLVITIDGMSGPPVPPNVRKLINLYVYGGFGGAITRPANFLGTLQNIPVEGQNIGHFSIIDAKAAQLLNYVLTAATPRAPRSTGKSERPAEAATGTSELNSR